MITRNNGFPLLAWVYAGSELHFSRSAECNLPTIYAKIESDVGLVNLGYGIVALVLCHTQSLSWSTPVRPKKWHSQPEEGDGLGRNR